MIYYDTSPTPTNPANPHYLVMDDLSTLITMLSASPAAQVLFDCETLGLPGMAFLIQIEDLVSKQPLIIRVRDHAPAQILKFIRTLACPDRCLIGHNVGFDLAKLTHLATVASILAAKNLDWSEEAVWNAEYIWRPGESTFEERLESLQIVWPSRCIDTYIAAQRMPPFANELQQNPGITFRRMPVTAIKTLAAKLSENLDSDGNGIEGRWRLGDHVKWAWDDKPCAAEKKHREHAIQANDHRVLADVRFSIRVPSAYSLKTLAPLLGYKVIVQRQEFQDIFGTADSDFPVWLERGGPKSAECGHIDAWNKSLELECDPAMLAYAASDITMLRVVYDYFANSPGFVVLEHDMALVPWASAIRMIGVHIDERARNAAQCAYLAKRTEGVEHCLRLGLKNINSSDQVVEFLNDNVIKNANAALPPDDEIEDVEDSRRKDTLEPLLKQLRIDKKKLATKNAGAGLDHAILNLEMLIQARVFDRKLQFIDSIRGDSVFPLFHITGTQTDRMTCTNPNSQQMPSPDRETAWEKDQEVHFRAMFTPPAGWQMCGGDFDQLELRIKSGITQDPFTQAIYTKETDADPADEHSETALKLFNKELHELLSDSNDDAILKLLKDKDKRVKHFRSKAKPIGFGIPYGASKYGIARNAECSEDEAEKMLADYWKLCPVTGRAIESVHTAVTTIRSDPNTAGILVAPPRAMKVKNKVGVARHFRIAQRLAFIAGKIADSAPGVDGLTYLERHFPDLANSPVTVIRGRDFVTGVASPVPVLKALRSALRGGAFGLQGSIHRQSFNFLIQSLGAYLTKELQARIYNRLITPGVHVASTLPLLCGLQVHDEIHYFCRSTETTNAVNRLTGEFLKRVSVLVGCPIRFQFNLISSWAEK